MIWLFVIIAVIGLSFGGILLYGAPYLPTLRPQVHAALELVNLRPGETLLELGCGDGKVLIAAAQTGVQVIGYELNPFLALVAWLRTRRFKRQVRVVWGNYWRQKWPPAQGIFVFLHPRFMKKLDKKIVQYCVEDVKLASFAFKIPGRVADHEKHGVYLYSYKPAVVPSSYGQA